MPPKYWVDTFDNYDECCNTKSWNKEACLERRPTVRPTMSPTLSSSTSFPTFPASTSFPTSTAPCPAEYDMSGATKYGRGSEVAVNHVVYRCKPVPYSTYCNKPSFRPPLEDLGDRGRSQLWRDAWERLYRCDYDPSASPSRTPFTSAPITNPTLSPSTSFPTLPAPCPSGYDTSGATKYEAGSEVAVNHVVYRCKPAPYSAYCNKPSFRPPLEDLGDMGHNQLWRDAWERLYHCEYGLSEPLSPIICHTRWHPGDDFKMRVCTNNPSYPLAWDDPVLLETYFTDTAEECCEKFYPGKKCRIRDECYL